MPTTAVRRIAFAALIAAASIGPIAACSDDSDDAADTDSTTTTAEATATASATDDLDAFCAAATELVGVTPTSEQLAEYAQLAPQDIAAPVETFIAAFESADGDLGAVFADLVDIHAQAFRTRFAFHRAARLRIQPFQGEFFERA